MAADVTHRLRRERAQSPAAEVYGDLFCPDVYHPEIKGDNLNTPIPMHMTTEELHARVARPSGKTNRIMDIRAVPASGVPAAAIRSLPS